MSQPAILELQRDIGYRFKDAALLIEALTHKSFKHEYPEDASSHNERLEFIGDSVVGLVVAEYLFKNEKCFDEAVMSRIKSHIVKRKVLAEVARGISMGSYLRVGKGEEGSGGRLKMSLLANAMEAVIGAVFEDGGYAAASKMVLRLVGERLEAAVASGDFSDYKSQLQELCQMRFGCLPEYNLVLQEGEEHRKTFTFEVLIDGKPFGQGTGHTKKEAQARAAKEALKNLETKL
jgi:ribonuclease-3